MQDIDDRGRGCKWLRVKRARFASMFKMRVIRRVIRVVIGGYLGLFGVIRFDVLYTSSLAPSPVPYENQQNPHKSLRAQASGPGQT